MKMERRGGERQNAKAAAAKETQTNGKNETETQIKENPAKNKDKKYAPPTLPKAVANKLWLVLSIHPLRAAHAHASDAGEGPPLLFVGGGGEGGGGGAWDVR